MNRPSRTDDDSGHPTWNQNPPFLAPDLTTREDLNGIANARVRRGHCSVTGGSFGLLDEKHLAGQSASFKPDSINQLGSDHAMVASVSCM
jgi:solute carrier family 39 (zinc transporter), member 1/2/3